MSPNPNLRPLPNPNPKPNQTVVAGVAGAPMELSCQVLIDGESKTVTFPMDFATDTPESVAREMVEELGIPAGVKCRPPCLTTAPHLPPY